MECTPQKGKKDADVLGHPLAPQLTATQALDQLGDALIPVLLWLTAGLTAAVGNGVTWLERFGPDLE